MHDLDSSSIFGCTLTLLFGLFAHITKSDVAVTVTIIAGLTTIAINIKKLLNKSK
jgi:sorbitol-specific phosphotransferase system component IIC